MSRSIIDAFSAEFHRYRHLSEGAASQFEWSDLRVALDPEVNSIAAIMKHVGGNLRSRWTEPFTSDGEKPWRNRDAEFVDDFTDRAAMMAAWNAGWDVLEASLATLTDADLGRTLSIRGEAHTLALALTRSSTHIAYHAGQIVQGARILTSRAGRPWKVLTVPRGGTAEYNRAMGYGMGRDAGKESPR